MLRLIAECGDDMSKWPTAKHFTSWLTLAPGSKISGGKVLSSNTRRSSNRATALLRMVAVNIGKTQTALGAFYRRLAARVGDEPLGQLLRQIGREIPEVPGTKEAPLHEPDEVFDRSPVGARQRIALPVESS